MAESILTQPVFPTIPIGSKNRPLYKPTGEIVSPEGKTSKPYRAIYQTAQGVQDVLPALNLAIARSQAATAQPLAQTELDIFKLLGPEYAAINTALNRQAQEGQAATDAALLAGTGKDVTRQTLEGQKIADPEFFRLRETLGTSADSLLKSIDPTQLTEAEIANIERTQNRSNIGQGTAFTGGNLAAIKNAMTFGDRLSQKQNSFAQTLSAIGNLAPQLKSGAFNYAAATGQAGAGEAQQQLGGNFSSTQQQSSNIASNLLGQGGSLTGNERNIKANKIPGWERTLAALPDYS